MLHPNIIFVSDICESVLRAAGVPREFRSSKTSVGKSGKELKQFGWIHEIVCPSENVIFVAELLNWRVQKLILHPKK